MGSHRTGRPPLVIGVASSLADRVRLAEALDRFGPVGLVLVSTLAEARWLLDGAGSGASSPEPEQPDHHDNGHDGPVTRVAGLSIDSDLLLMLRDGRRVGLTPLEHELLVCLASEPRRTWTHAALHETVWKTRHSGGQADIHSLVKRLRRKLSALGASARIEAVRGIGFRLTDSA